MLVLPRPGDTTHTVAMATRQRHRIRIEFHAHAAGQGIGHATGGRPGKRHQKQKGEIHIILLYLQLFIRRCRLYTKMV